MLCAHDLCTKTNIVNGKILCYNVLTPLGLEQMHWLEHGGGIAWNPFWLI